VTNLETIDIRALSTITGGGNSTSWMQLNERITTKSGGTKSVTKTTSSQISDYDACVGAVSGMAGATATDISSVCGPRSGSTNASPSTRL
jgi:hypothetical protein